MGKYVLLLVMAAAGVWTLAQQQTTLQTAETEVEREEEVLARQAARTGLNSLLAETRTVADDKCPDQIVESVDTTSGTYEAWLEKAPGVDLGYRAHAKGQFPGENGVTVTIDRLIQRTESREGLIYGEGEESGKLKQTTATGSEAFGSAPQGSAPKVRGMGALATNLDGDEKDEIPYVRKSNRSIKMIDKEGNTQVLVPSGVNEGEPAEEKTRLSTGEWDIDGRKSVFYANKDHDSIYRVSWDSGSPTDPELVRSPNNGAQAILGIDDIDGDGNDELVFADGSQHVRYIDGPEGPVRKLPNGGGGSDEGIGVGRMADLDGDGTASAVFINGSNNLRVVNADDTDRTIYLGGESDDGAAKTPPTAIDLDGDDDREIAYLREEDGDPDVEYVDPDGSSTRPLCGISVNEKTGLVSTR